MQIYLLEDMLKPEITKKIEKSFRNIPLFLAKRAFLVFVVFVLFVILLSLLLSYLYLWSVEKKEIAISPKKVTIDQEIFEEFLEHYKKREERFRNALEENYIDIFFR